MSIRTVVEINHDFLSRIEAEPVFFATTIGLALRSAPSARETLRLRFGVRILAERHHSDGIDVRVNGRERFAEPPGRKS